MFKEELKDLEQRHLLRTVTVMESQDGPFVFVNGRKLLLMCSNDYLGLARHEAVRKAAVEALGKYGFGSGASRLVSGTSPLHRELEARIARFKGTEAALLFNSGYAANAGILQAIAGEGDLIVSDSLNHASIIDGCRLSRAEVKVYRHGDVNHAEETIKKSTARRIVLVTDGVFSMDGDLAPLPDLTALAEQYNAVLLVDDAHGTGVLGPTGKGTVEHFGLAGRVPIQMGTFGKALGSFGAFVAGTKELIDYLVNRSRSFIYSTALPPAVCAASLAALDVVEREPHLRERLLSNRDRFVNGLGALGIVSVASGTPIMPIVIGPSSRALQAARKLTEEGVFASAIRPPTVPEGTARIRTTVTALQTHSNIDLAVAAFSRLKEEGYLQA